MLSSVVPQVRYFAIHGGSNIARAIGSDYAYLSDSGEWIESPSVFRHVTGIGGDADGQEITREQAMQWVADNRPGVSVEWK
jgi:hypothetical protein